MCVSKTAVALTIVLLFVIVAVGCASMQSGSQGAASNYKKAIEEEDKGNSLGALYYASESLLTDPEQKSAREFIYSRYDDIIAENLSKVKTLKKPYTLDALKELSRVYWSLNAINRNLARASLPFSSQLQDYKTEGEIYTLMGMNACTREIQRALAKDLLDDADKFGLIAVDSFYKYKTDAHENAYKHIFDVYYRYARRNAGSSSIERMLLAEHTYNIIIYFNPEDEAAVKELEKLSLKLSKNYYFKGMAEKRQGTPEAHVNALESFNKSLEYNPEHTKAAEALEGLIEDQN